MWYVVCGMWNVVRYDVFKLNVVCFSGNLKSYDWLSSIFRQFNTVI